MSQQTVTKCDICGIERKQTNHWWILDYNSRTRSTFSYPLEERLSTIDENTLFICGLEHLVLAESRVRTGLDPKTGQ